MPAEVQKIMSQSVATLCSRPAVAHAVLQSQESSQIMSQGMMSSSGVTTLPFKEGSKAIQSPVVQVCACCIPTAHGCSLTSCATDQEEFKQMVAEHKSLVKLGEGYGKWDRTGKLMYIDQVSASASLAASALLMLLL